MLERSDRSPSIEPQILDRPLPKTNSDSPPIFAGLFHSFKIKGGREMGETRETREMGEISGLFFLMKKPKSRKNVSIERTVRGSGDRAQRSVSLRLNRCFASVRGAQSLSILTPRMKQPCQCWGL